MPRSTDLAGLFPSGPNLDVGFTQGVVVSWDEATGTNAVDVKGTVLTNLPALNIGEFAILQEGDVVGLLSYKSTYFILGRIILPAGPDRNRASVDFGFAGGFATGHGLNTPKVNRAPAVITAPDWADEAIVMVGIGGQAINGRSVQDYLGMQPVVEGATIGAAGLFFVAAPGNFASGSYYASTRLTSVGSTITAEAQIWANGGAWGANESNYVQTNATAIFRRVD